MGLGFASWSLLLHLVLLVMCIQHGNGVRELTENLMDTGNKLHEVKMQDMKESTTNVLRLPSEDGDDKKEHRLINHEKHDHDHDHHHHHSSSHMNHMDADDPSIHIFFTLKDLKVGNIMPMYFPKREPLSSPHFLPREESDSIPFSSKQLPYLLELFSYPQDSLLAKAMKETLINCERKPMIGETKFCATSFESMLDYTRDIFGLDSHLDVLTTTYLTESTTLFQNYTILEVPQQILAPKIVPCHSLPYPYAVFYCHSLDGENKVFKVSLGGQNGHMVDALAVCHMDTSHWGRNHVSFRMLGIEPGSSHVCHFFFNLDNFVWVPIPTPL